MKSENVLGMLCKCKCKVTFWRYAKWRLGYAKWRLGYAKWRLGLDLGLGNDARGWCMQGGLCKGWCSRVDNDIWDMQNEDKWSRRQIWLIDKLIGFDNGDDARILNNARWRGYSTRVSQNDI